MTANSVNTTTTEILFAAFNCFSILVCLLAAILVCTYRLCSTVVYRLALYQVLSSLALAGVSVLQIVFVDYYSNPEAYGRACVAIGWSFTYAEWVKLLFTMWVTFHLFCFAVIHKNLKKLEVLYVGTSLFVPAVIASVPLITDTYTLSPDGACYIYVKNDATRAAAIERFALWDGPAMVILLAASTAMIVMVIKLAKTLCGRSKYEPITDGDQYWRALKQLLPLAAFPIVFFMFEIPEFIFHVYLARIPTPEIGITIAVKICISLWSMASGVALTIHVLVAKCSLKRTRIECIQPSMSAYGSRSMTA